MFKHTVLLLSLNIFAIFGEKSFTLVLDTTNSMRDKIHVIKANIGQVVHSANATDIGNYILVPFKDVSVNNPFITTSPRSFNTHVGAVTPRNGSDCPENSLEGIETALRISSPESYIFVFTDAFAKDLYRFQSVEALCKESHSQVIIFLSGFCRAYSVDVYYDVARSCSGAFFQFNTTYELRQAFTFMKEIINTEWTDITPQEKFSNFKELRLTVDSFTTDFLISMSGSNLTMNILDENNHLVRPYRVFETKNSLVIRLDKPNPGLYSLNIRGLGVILVTFYERNYVPFQYGFSTKSPRSLMETCMRPMPGGENYLLISVDTEIKLNSIEYLRAGENVKKVLYLMEKRPGLYITSFSVEPEKSFRIWIVGEDVVTQQYIRGSTKYIYPQTQVSNATSFGPEAQILDTDLDLINYGTEVTLACKVTGVPKPTILWEDEDGSNFPAEDVLLEIPSVYISYVTITNVTKNSTLYCKCDNSNGATSQSIALFVNRTFSFEVIQSPEDTNVDYGDDLKLSCQVDAFPEATITWYLNDSQIYSNERIAIKTDSLLVKNVSLEDGGVYQCEASNEVETKKLTATVEISGLEMPEIEITDTEISSKPGDSIHIDCSVTKGKPTPEIAWEYKLPEAFEFDDLPAGTTVEDGNLQISSADTRHVGVYKCTASNLLGTTSKDVTVKIQFAPVIKNDERETITVREGERVQLPCEVESIPEATVRWEMSQDDVIISLNEDHRIDKKHTLHFTALWSNAGNYHCIAENNVGKAERTVTVNVLVPPYIEAPQRNTVLAKIGDNVNLTCTVLFGNPAPRIKWIFIAVDSTSRTIVRDNSTLRLENVSESDEGSYLCIAENQISTDNIKYSLRVKWYYNGKPLDTKDNSFNELPVTDWGKYTCQVSNVHGSVQRTFDVTYLVPPYIEAPQRNTVLAKIGDNVNLTCIVLFGNPAPRIKWIFIAVDSTSRTIVRDNSTLRLENVSESDEGSYLCIAENQISTDNIKYSLRVH